MTRPKSVGVRADALQHLSGWARGCTLGGMGLHPELLATLDEADIQDDGATILLTLAGAEQLLALDVRAHGYGPKRCLRSDRKDCDGCALVGVALEQMISRLGVRRAKSPAG